MSEPATPNETEQQDRKQRASDIIYNRRRAALLAQLREIVDPILSNLASVPADSSGNRFISQAHPQGIAGCTIEYRNPLLPFSGVKKYPDPKYSTNQGDDFIGISVDENLNVHISKGGKFRTATTINASSAKGRFSGKKNIYKNEEFTLAEVSDLETIISEWASTVAPHSYDFMVSQNSESLLASKQNFARLEEQIKNIATELQQKASSHADVITSNNSVTILLPSEKQPQSALTVTFDAQNSLLHLETFKKNSHSSVLTEQHGTLDITKKDHTDQAMQSITTWLQTESPKAYAALTSQKQGFGIGKFRLGN